MTNEEKKAAEVRALQELYRHPERFLKKNAIVPQNAFGNVAGVAEYSIEIQDKLIERPGTILGNRKQYKDGQWFKIARPLVAQNGFKFHAIYIPVQPSNAPINGFLLPTEGTNLMITTQLTGCCIVMIPMGNTWSVAHLRPTGETGIQLRDRLAAAGMRVYGANDYSGGRAALIGVRNDGKWRFYVQTFDSGIDVVVTGARKLKF